MRELRGLVAMLLDRRQRVGGELLQRFILAFFGVAVENSRRLSVGIDLLCDIGCVEILGGAAFSLSIIR